MRQGLHVSAWTLLLTALIKLGNNRVCYGCKDVIVAADEVITSRIEGKVKDGCGIEGKGTEGGKLCASLTDEEWKKMKESNQCEWFADKIIQEKKGCRNLDNFSKKLFK
jgi:hypothetical protein